MNILFDKERIFAEELIRENARLIVQHEVNRQKIVALERQVAEQAANIASLEVHSHTREDADDHRHTEAALREAITDLHFVMAGGDPCKVCTVKCTMGTGECKPVWKGEE